MRSGFLFTVITILAVSCLADTFIVDLNGNGDHLTIQGAIDGAIDGDTILIRDGIYSGEENRDIDFKGKALTVTSENGPENCTVNCQGTEQEPHRGFLFHSGESRDSILDGITIINGTTVDSPFNGGGGIACKYSSNPTIKNCILKNNTTGEWQGGGGIYCMNSSPFIFGCTISDNVAGNGEGGAIATIYSNPIIENCVISNNHNGATHFGGSPGSSPTIRNCLIINNKGVGIKCDNRSNPKIINSTICGNISYSAGGLWSFADCSIQIYNSIIWGNYGYNPKTGKYDRPSQIQISDDYIKIDYSCIQGGEKNIHIYDEGTVNWKENNIDVNPIFIDPLLGNYRLDVDSPCIETGNNTFISEEFDLDGNPRLLDGDYDGRLVVDMGAYEAPKSEFPVISLSPWKIDCVNYIEQDEQPEYILEILNSGSGEFSWSIISSCPWLEVFPLNGVTASEIDEVSIRILADNLESGNYETELIIESSETLNGTQVLPISLTNIDKIIPVPSQFETIQEGIDKALEGYTVVIDDGIYKGQGNTNLFVYKPITIRSKNGSEHCIVDCEDMYPCIRGVFERETGFTLEGLTIQNAVEIQEKSAIEILGQGAIKDCIIQGCKINQYLGVILLGYGAKIEDCIVRNNMSGIFCGENATIRNCEILNNYGGPAVLCWRNNADIIWNNILGNDGGGMLLVQSSPTISNCIIKNNVILVEHDGFGYGGGASCFFESNPIIKNTLIEGNYAEFGGGGICCEADSHASLVNCDVLGNKSLEIGGGIWVLNESSLNINNSIIFENSSSLGNQIAQEYPQYPGNSIVTLNYSCLQKNDGDIFDGESLALDYGEGNLVEDPRFSIAGYWNDEGTSEDWMDDVWYSGNYDLQEESPCIDTGDPNYVPLPDEIDLEGYSRLMGAIVDMGCYEYLPPIEAKAKITPQSLNRKSHRSHVIGRLELTGYSVEDIDPDEPMVLMPGDIEAYRVDIQGSKKKGESVSLQGYFDNEALMDIIEQDGDIEVTISVRLLTGQWAYGVDTVKVK